MAKKQADLTEERISEIISHGKLFSMKNDLKEKKIAIKTRPFPKESLKHIAQEIPAAIPVIKELKPEINEEQVIKDIKQRAIEEQKQVDKDKRIEHEKSVIAKIKERAKNKSRKESQESRI